MKLAKQNLRTPGPTPVPDDVFEAMTNPMIDHRGPEFFQLITQATEKLKQVFMTRNDLLILTASGDGALKAAVVNTLSPGDKVLSASAGALGASAAAGALAAGVAVDAAPQAMANSNISTTPKARS